MKSTFETFNGESFGLDGDLLKQEGSKNAAEMPGHIDESDEWAYVIRIFWLHNEKKGIHNYTIGKSVKKTNNQKQLAAISKRLQQQKETQMLMGIYDNKKTFVSDANDTFCRGHASNGISYQKQHQNGMDNWFLQSERIRDENGDVVGEK